MGTFVDFRAALRLDLNDPAGGSQRFADGDLDRAVTRAVAELSAVYPRELDQEHVVAAASRTIALTAAPYTGVLVGVSEVEIPYGVAGANATNPPTLVPFRLAPDRTSMLLLSETVPAVNDRIRVRWTAAWSISAGASTVPADFDWAIARGAAGYAALAYSTPAGDNFRYDDGSTVAGVDDSMIPREWRLRGETWLGEWRKFLQRLTMQRLASGRSWVSWGERAREAGWPTSQEDGGREP